MRFGVCAFFAFLALLAAPAFAQTFPPLTDRVVDAAHILSPEAIANIRARSEAVERQSGAQLVVATVPSLEGYSIEDYGYRLGRYWEIGEKGRDNGVILLVAPNERRVRIEVGYGLEPVLTDALSSVIIRRAILPQFRNGAMSDGVEAGFNAIARQLELSPEDARTNVAAAEKVQKKESAPLGSALLIVAIFLVWMWFASRGGQHGYRRRGWFAPIVFWGGGPRGPGGGPGGGFGGGGGGFSGGGGGFGGGGASGGW